MKLGLSRGMDTKRPRGSDRSKPCHESQLTRRSLPPYPWPPEQAQPGVSKPCRTTWINLVAAALGALGAIILFENFGGYATAAELGQSRPNRQIMRRIGVGL